MLFVFLHTGMFRLRFDESNMFLEAPRVFRFLLVAWQLVHSRCQHSVHAKYLISRNLCYVGWWRLLAHVSPKQFFKTRIVASTLFLVLSTALYLGALRIHSPPLTQARAMNH